MVCFENKHPPIAIRLDLCDHKHDTETFYSEMLSFFSVLVNFRFLYATGNRIPSCSCKMRAPTALLIASLQTTECLAINSVTSNYKVFG